MINSVIDLSTLTQPQIQQIIDIIKAHNYNMLVGTSFRPGANLSYLSNKSLVCSSLKKVWCLGIRKHTHTPSEFITQFSKSRLNFKL